MNRNLNKVGINLWRQSIEFHRQVKATNRWTEEERTHNIGIAASGAGRCNFDCLHRCTLVRADEYLFGFLLLTSTLYFQLGSGSGLDEQ